MSNGSYNILILLILLLPTLACTHNEALEEGRDSNGNPIGRDMASPQPRQQATPGKNFTAADVAKLKWIEGSWRGMDGDKPFYERYKLEANALVVEPLKEDGSPDGEAGRFELKNGEFGKGEGNQRSAASEITDSYIQFVPAPAAPTDANANGAKPRRNSFRFEKQSDGTWIALLEWTASADKPAQAKVYKMEPWPKK